MTWRAEAGWWLLMLGALATTVDGTIGLLVMAAGVQFWVWEFDQRPPT